MTRRLKIQFYLDRKKEWRWRIKSGAKVLADSGEGYKRLASAVKGFNRSAGAKLVVVDSDVKIDAFDRRNFTVEVIR